VNSTGFLLGVRHRGFTISRMSANTTNTNANTAGNSVVQTPESPTSPEASAQNPPGFKSKAIAGLLSFFGGGVGAHWFYLGRPRPWALGLLALLMLALASQAEVKDWWDTPAIFVLFIPILVGFIEAIVFCLTSDEKFDARYNPGLTRQVPSRWAPVLVAIFSLLFGTVLMLFGIAIVVLHIWTRLGWLEGLNF